jgi:hypothetical protein
MNSVVTESSPSFNLGSINGTPLQVGKSDLSKTDRLIIGMFMTLGPDSTAAATLQKTVFTPTRPCAQEAREYVVFMNGPNIAASSSDPAYSNFFSCVRMAAVQAVNDGFNYMAGLGSVALGMMTLGGVPSMAKALPSAALLYTKVMNAGMQLAIGAGLANVNDAAAKTALKNGIAQSQDLVIDPIKSKVVETVYSQEAGAIRDLCMGLQSLSTTFSTHLAGPAGCAYQVVPSGKQFLSNAGQGGFMVTAGPGCSWTAVSSAPSWITVGPGAAGTGDGIVYFQVTANTFSEEREAVISVEDQDYVITQSAPAVVVAGPFDGTWRGAFSGLFTYATGGTYNYNDELLGITVKDGAITGGAPVLGSGTIDALGNGSWLADTARGMTPFVFTGTFSTGGAASGTWTFTIAGTGPQSGAGNGTWSATRQ